MTSRPGRVLIGMVIVCMSLLASSCGQKGPLYLPDDPRTAADRAAGEPIEQPRNADSGMPEAGISTSEVSSRPERETPEEQMDEEEITTE